MPSTPILIRASFTSVELEGLDDCFYFFSWVSDLSAPIRANSPGRTPIVRIREERRLPSTCRPGVPSRR